MKTEILCAALILSYAWAPANGFAQTPIESTAAFITQTPIGTDTARRDLLRDTVAQALRNAESKLANGRIDDAIAMAWAGLDQAAALSATTERTAMMESLMLVIVDARVQKELAHRQSVADAQSHTARAEPSRDRNTGLSTEVPPDRLSPLAEALIDLGEPPDIPDRVVHYPRDWNAANSRASTPRTPTLYESEPFENQNGETVQTVVYDVRTLLLPTPHFYCTPLRDLYESTRVIADREALRDGSAIFNGYAHDLAAGIPLLAGFGGPCSWPADLGDGEREMAELVRLIEEMTAP